MKHTICCLYVLLLLLFSDTHSYAQNKKQKYIFGKMYNPGDTLTGYFKFDTEINSNGQTVWYKADINAKRHDKKFQSRKYEAFDSDSLHMETFGTLPGLTGDLLIMIPRIVNGTIEVYYYNISGWGIAGVGRANNFCIKYGNTRLKLKKKKYKEILKKYIIDEEFTNIIDADNFEYKMIPELIQAYNLKYASSRSSILSH